MWLLSVLGMALLVHLGLRFIWWVGSSIIDEKYDQLFK